MHLYLYLYERNISINCSSIFVKLFQIEKNVGFYEKLVLYIECSVFFMVIYNRKKRRILRKRRFV